MRTVERARTDDDGGAEDAEGRRSALERFLRLFTDVRAGEGGKALLLMLSVFLILTAYYFIKPVREALILAQAGGAEVKSYAAAGQAILLLGAVPLYGKLASRFPRRPLINIVTLFFIACLGAFFVLARTDLPIGVVFYLWVGIFNLMVVAQFWSFANDVYTAGEGERLFPIVAFGASAGAVVGSVVAGRLIEPLGVEQLLLVGGVVLAGSLLLMNVVHAREMADGHSTGSEAGNARDDDSGGGDAGDSRASGTNPGPDPEPGGDEPLPKSEAFGLVMRNRYLLLIALLLLFLNWVNTTGEYILARVVEDAAIDAVQAGDAASRRRFIGSFYSDFFAVVNVAGLLIQAFLVSRIFKYFGVRVAVLVLPVLALGAYALLAFYPILTAVRWAKTAENATDYSLNNTVRHALFLPTEREEKYNAKQAIDTFFVRAGDVLSAVLVFAGTRFLAFRTDHFAMANLALVAVWIVIGVLIGIRYRRLVPEGEDVPAAVA